MAATIDSGSGSGSDTFDSPIVTAVDSSFEVKRSSEEMLEIERQKAMKAAIFEQHLRAALDATGERTLSEVQRAFISSESFKKRIVFSSLKVEEIEAAIEQAVEKITPAQITALEEIFKQKMDTMAGAQTCHNQAVKAIKLGMPLSIIHDCIEYRVFHRFAHMLEDIFNLIGENRLTPKDLGTLTGIDLDAILRHKLTLEQIKSVKVQLDDTDLALLGKKISFDSISKFNRAQRLLVHIGFRVEVVGAMTVFDDVSPEDVTCIYPIKSLIDKTDSESTRQKRIEEISIDLPRLRSYQFRAVQRYIPLDVVMNPKFTTEVAAKALTGEEFDSLFKTALTADELSTKPLSALQLLVKLLKKGMSFKEVSEFNEMQLALVDEGFSVDAVSQMLLGDYNNANLLVYIRELLDGAGENRSELIVKINEFLPRLRSHHYLALQSKKPLDVVMNPKFTAEIAEKFKFTEEEFQHLFNGTTLTADELSIKPLTTLYLLVKLLEKGMSFKDVSEFNETQLVLVEQGFLVKTVSGMTFDGDYSLLGSLIKQKLDAVSGKAKEEFIVQVSDFLPRCKPYHLESINMVGVPLDIVMDPKFSPEIFEFVKSSYQRGGFKVKEFEHLFKHNFTGLTELALVSTKKTADELAIFERLLTRGEDLKSFMDLNETQLRLVDGGFSVADVSGVRQQKKRHSPYYHDLIRQFLNEGRKEDRIRELSPFLSRLECHHLLGLIESRKQARPLSPIDVIDPKFTDLHAELIEEGYGWKEMRDKGLVRTQLKALKMSCKSGYEGRKLTVQDVLEWSAKHTAAMQLGISGDLLVGRDSRAVDELINVPCPSSLVLRASASAAVSLRSGRGELLLSPDGTAAATATIAAVAPSVASASDPLPLVPSRPPESLSVAAPR